MKEKRFDNTAVLEKSFSFVLKKVCTSKDLCSIPPSKNNWKSGFYSTQKTI